MEAERHPLRTSIFCLLALLLVTRAAAAEFGFDFRGSQRADWHATHDVELTPAADGLRIAITGHDPYLMSPRFAVPTGNRLVVKIRLKSETGGAGQLFYFTENTLEKDSVRFGVPAGDWQDLWLTIPECGPRVRFRLDPPGTSGVCVVESIQVQAGLTHSWPTWAEQPALPPEESYLLRSGTIELAHSKTQAGQFEVTVAGQPTATSGVVPQIAIAIDGKMVWLPLASREVELRGENTVRSQAQADLPGGGSITLVQQFSRSGDGVIDCVAELKASQACDLVYAPLLMVFPGHRSYGDQKQQALFAGVEYLENEPSSSDADVDAARALRRVPAAYKITIPLMAVQTEDRYIGLIWKPLPQKMAAYFDTPDRRMGTKSQVLGLIAPGAADGRREDGQELPLVPTHLEPNSPITAAAQLIGGAGRSVIPSVQKYVELYGLPDIPAKFSKQETAELLTAGWLDSPLKVGNRFRHAVVGNTFHPQPAADAIWMMRQLAAMNEQGPDSARLRQAAAAALGDLPADHLHHAAVGHVRAPNATLLLGDPAQGIQQARAVAAGQLAQLGSEGRIIYQKHPERPDFSRTHWSKEANGLDALAVDRALSEAIFSGDAALIDQAIAQLRKMDRHAGTVPRGAQTWEIPLHTPDILASAHLVHAYMQGYEVTRDPQFLEQARYWAWTGVPFLYLQPQFEGAVGPYATIPVLGATHWDSVLWIGLPVQWCGLVYADALQSLARYDAIGPWKHLADGIVISGLQQTYPDGPHRGLLPDSFNVQGQSRNPADINPGTLQVPAMQTVLGWKSYDMRKILESGWTVVAPAEIVLGDALPTRARFEVQGWAKEPYFVLVHGLKSRPKVETTFTATGTLQEDRFEASTGTLILHLQGKASVTLDTSGE
jgi:hypothetical protein